MIQFVHFQGYNKGTVAIELPSVEKLIEVEKRLENEGFVSFTARIGFSTCHEDDMFKKSIGRGIANSRLEIRTLTAYSSSKKQVQTKNGVAEKVTLDCILPIIEEIGVQIYHIGPNSEPRVHISDDFIIYLANKERKRII